VVTQYPYQSQDLLFGMRVEAAADASNHQILIQSTVRLADMPLAELVEAKQLQVKPTQSAVTVLTELVAVAAVAVTF
jgi:hypothetical protein